MTEQTHETPTNTDLISNMDELQAEHEAEKAVAEAKAKAEQEALDEARRAEYLKTEEVARAARIQARLPVLQKIADAVNAASGKDEDDENFHLAEVGAVDGKLLIDGVDVSWKIDFVQERTHISSWRSKENGKLRLSVGSYGSRTSFPQRKDGGHNYAEIARILVGYAHRKNAEARADIIRKLNQRTVASLAAELIPSDKNGYQDVITASTSRQSPIRFRFKIDHAMSPDRARALAAAIRAAGIKLHYSDEG